MASKAKIIQCIAGIKTLYPYFAKDTDTEMLVGMWTALLKEYTDEQVSKGLALAMKVCTMPPTPADVIKQISKGEGRTLVDFVKERQQRIATQERKKLNDRDMVAEVARQESPNC